MEHESFFRGLHFGLIGSSLTPECNVVKHTVKAKISNVKAMVTDKLLYVRT